MRAARVLDMLLVLQRRGRMTARELADAFEVSERTVLRDVEALSEAGVPIYASRGAGGGISLLDGFETRLTGLTEQEAGSLLLVGQPRVAHRLGLAAPARSAHAKLGAALPGALAGRADALTAWFLHDPDPWQGHTIPHGELRRIAGCITARCRVELRFPDGDPVTVEPLGLVLKAGSWYLVVHDADASPPFYDVLCLDRLRATRLTRQPFTRPTGFTLQAVWAAHTAQASLPGAPDSCPAEPA